MNECKDCKKELSKKLINISTGECVNCNCKEEKVRKIEYASPNICIKCQGLYWDYEVLINFGVCRNCITNAEERGKKICHNCYKEVENVGSITHWCMECKSKPREVQKLSEGLYQCSECQQVVLEIDKVYGLCIKCHHDHLIDDELAEDVFNPSFVCKNCETFYWGTAENGLCNKCRQRLVAGKLCKEQITISYEEITKDAADYILDNINGCNGKWLQGFEEGLMFATKEAQNQIDRRK